MSQEISNIGLIPLDFNRNKFSFNVGFDGSNSFLFYTDQEGRQRHIPVVLDTDSMQFTVMTKQMLGGGTTSGGVDPVGLKNASAVTINPATEDTLSTLSGKVTACNTGAIQGTVSVTQNAILRKTVDLASSGAVHTPTSGKKVRVFACQFSLTADMTSVAFRWTSGGSDWHKFLNVKGGGYYGTNTNEKYTEGGTDQALYCNISGTGTVCVNLAYTEV